MDNFFPPRKGKRILICVRGQCAESGQGKQLEKHLNHLIQQYGLENEEHPKHTTCTITNCLGVCEGGPVMIVHPDAIKYHHVDKAALDKIFHSHILNNKPVNHLIVSAQTPRRKFK
jgi:(2Fe-2S) ferredoxin